MTVFDVLGTCTLSSLPQAFSAFLHNDSYSHWNEFNVTVQKSLQLKVRRTSTTERFINALWIEIS